MDAWHVDEVRLDKATTIFGNLVDEEGKHSLERFLKGLVFEIDIGTRRIYEAHGLEAGNLQEAERCLIVLRQVH